MNEENRWQRLRSGLSHALFSRPVKWLLALIILFFAAYLCRHPILRACGNFLITPDPLVHADAIYVLGGASLERGTEAGRLYREGWAPLVICTGGVVPQLYRAENIDRTEAEVTHDVAIRKGVAAYHCLALEVGTSTKEEADAILVFAQQHDQDTVIIATSLFHLRRVRSVFRKSFERAGITVVLTGAPSMQFDEQRWWEKEEGLMMCQNEYVKLLYYLWKY